MRYQSTDFSCGAAAIVNALRSLGKRVAERRVMVLAGTNDKDGTSPPGIIAAVRELGFVANEYESADAASAWGWLSDCLRSSRPVILCVSNWQHWVTAIGILGDRVVIVDPTNAAKNKTENGIFVLPKRDFMRKWKHSVEMEYAGISVGKR